MTAYNAALQAHLRTMQTAQQARADDAKSAERARACRRWATLHRPRRLSNGDDWTYETLAYYLYANFGPSRDDYTPAQQGRDLMGWWADQEDWAPTAADYAHAGKAYAAAFPNG